MANTFKIVISATDKATDTVRKVNKSINSLTRPFQDVGKSFKSLGRELGFEKIGKNLGSIGASAERAAKGIGSIVAPMAAITGIASVAGIVSLADGWAKLGRSITYSSQSIGVSTTKLQEFQGAAKLSGLSAEAMTQGLQSLGDTMEDALYGRNQQALMVFNRLGVGIKRTKTGAMDAAGEFRSLATAIYKLPTPQAQNLAAGQVGLTALLPLIRQGPAAMDQLIARARQLGLVMSDTDVKSANEFAGNLSALQASGEGLRNSIGNALIPAIKPLLEQLTSWISKNRGLIASKIGAWAQDFAKWLGTIDWQKVGQGITSLVNGIGNLVDKLGGWKAAAIEVGVVLNAGLIANVIALTYNISRLGIGIGSLITKFFQMSTAAKAAGAASEAATAATAGGGFLSKLAGGGSIFKLFNAAMVAPRPAMSPEEFNAHVQSTLGKSANESTWQQWSDVFHGRTNYWHDAFSRHNTPVGRPTAAQAGPVMGSLEKLGWTHAQAAGLAANFGEESGFNPSAVGDNGSAYGIGQWHADRQAAFAAWAGHDIHGSSLDEQLRFANFELTQGKEQKAGNALRAATSAQQAGAIVSVDYERPAAVAEAAAHRAGLAGEYDKAPSSVYPKSGDPNDTASNDAAAVASAAGGDNAVSKIEVTFKDAPPGLQARVVKQGNTAVTTRVQYSGVGASA